MIKRLILFLVLLVSAVPIKAAEPVSLTLWTQEGRDDGAYYFILNKVDEFMARNPDIRINVFTKPTEDLRLDFMSASLRGDAPELLWTVSDHAGPFFAANLIRPVDDLYEADRYIESIMFEGQTWGVPIFSGNHLMLLYNRRLVPEAPETFEELIAIGQEVSDGSTFGLVYNIIEPFWLIPFLGGYGGRVFADDGFTPILDTPEMVQTLQFIYDLKYKYAITPKEIDYGRMDSLFKEGRAAFMINGDWGLSDYSNVLGDRLGVARMPALPGGGLPRPYISGKYFMVSRDVNRAELEAIEAFMTFMTSDEVLLDGLFLLNRLPASLSGLQSENLVTHPILGGSASQLATGIPMPTVIEMRANWDAMKPELNLVLDGLKTPEQAAADMQRAVERMLAEGSDETRNGILKSAD
jgi:arabinogalactan oligomer/maltooligosaccharide transport system substrate-binding protein